MEEKNISKVTDLMPDVRKIILDKNPGYYKWWAKETEFEIILNKLKNITAHNDTEKIKNTAEQKIIDGDTYYCVYVGVAIREPLCNRLYWHINKKANLSNVKWGTLSTLRQTISSIVGKNMLDNDATDAFLDKLCVEYFISNNEVKSISAKKEISEIEKHLLSGEDYLYILNIQGNKHPDAPSKEIKALRKIAKQIVK